MSNSSLALTLAILATAPLVLGSCERSAKSPQAPHAEQGTSPPEGQGSTVASAAPTDSPRPSSKLAIDIEGISGGWRVVESSRENSLLIGAIAEIYPENASWSYRPTGAQGLDQFCQEPVLEDLSAERAPQRVRELTTRIAGPLAPRAVTHPHELRCAAGGDWGPAEGADLMLLTNQMMVMLWFDGERLELERIDRPAPKAVMSPEDYKADNVR